MMPSKRVSEARPNLSSERRQKLQRRLLSSLNAQLAREEDFFRLRDASLSFWERKKRFPKELQSFELTNNSIKLYHTLMQSTLYLSFNH